MTGSEDGTLLVWDVVKGGAPLLKLEGHTGFVTCLAALDGDRLASGGQDKSVIVWNLADRAQL